MYFIALIPALWVGYWLVGLAAILVGTLYKLHIEERFMAEEFGDAYARCRAEVAALVPYTV
jgi:protein-S-isoprenylcysteine O-methyltransferase Ste14